MKKQFKLKAEELLPLVGSLGSCIASDRITVDGKPVGWMYREEPDNDIDSGWRLLAGDESPAFAEDASDFEIYDVNTIANYDPSIISLLDEPAGTAWNRAADGTWEPDLFPGPDGYSSA